MNPHEASPSGLHSTHPAVSSSLTHSMPHFPTPRMHPLLTSETAHGHSLHPTHGTVSSNMGHGIPQLPSTMNPQGSSHGGHIPSLHSAHHPQATVSSSLNHNIPQLSTQRMNPQERGHVHNLHSTHTALTVSSSLGHSGPQLQVPNPRMSLQIPEVIHPPSLHHIQTAAPTLRATLGLNMESDDTKRSFQVQPTVGDNAPIKKSEKKLKKKKGKKEKGVAEEKLTQKGKLRKMPTKITPEVLVIINRIISYFEREKACQQPLYAWRCVNSRVAQATGLSPRTIQRIREAEKKRPPGQPIVKKIRKKSTGRPSTLKESDRFHISNTLDNMQRSKEPVTLAKLKTKLDASGLVISRSTLARIIQKMGFRYTPSRSEKGKAHEEREKNEERGAWSRDQSAKEKWEKEMHQRIKQQAEREAASSHSAQHAVNSQLPVHVQQPVRNEQSAIHTHGGGSGRVELDDDQHGYLREFGHEEDSVDGASDRSDEMQLGNFLREFGQEAVTTAYGAGGNHS